MSNTEAELDAYIESLIDRIEALLSLPRHDYEVREAHELLQLVALWRIQKALRTGGDPYRK